MCSFCPASIREGHSRAGPFLAAASVPSLGSWSSICGGDHMAPNTFLAIAMDPDSPQNLLGSSLLCFLKEDNLTETSCVQALEAQDTLPATRRRGCCFPRFPDGARRHEAVHPGSHSEMRPHRGPSDAQVCSLATAWAFRQLDAAFHSLKEQGSQTVTCKGLDFLIPVAWESGWSGKWTVFCPSTHGQRTPMLAEALGPG